MHEQANQYFRVGCSISMGRYMGSYYHTLGSICDAKREDKLGGRVEDYDIYNVEATCSSSWCAGYGRGYTREPKIRIFDVW
jgi:hypothetical protein